MENTHTVILINERETKGTVVFTAAQPDAAVTTLYVSKSVPKIRETKLLKLTLELDPNDTKTSRSLL